MNKFSHEEDHTKSTKGTQRSWRDKEHKGERKDGALSVFSQKKVTQT